MGDFRALFGIHIEHGYFANGKCASLDYIPDEPTKRLMMNTGLLIKKTDSGILVLHDHEARESLRSHLEDEPDEFVLCFKLYATDPAFMSYTEPFSDAGQQLLYFDSRYSTPTDNGSFRLHNSSKVTNTYLKDPNADQLQGILSPHEILLPPIAVIRFADIGRFNLLDRKEHAKTPIFYIVFDSRQTYWKYYLLCDAANEATYIHDPEKRVGFTSAGAVVLPDGRSAYSYSSTRLIPLRERYDFRFQLKQPKNGGERILFRQLPFASVGRIGKEVVANRSRVVSEIYINC